ncbi:AAA family ATPase [Phenylobacterium sp.]|uniref:AAA family ATPase n=1 Tax=Phenylobacterium sp. TaxID=1871053 RepID=UPI003D27DC79
MSIVERKSQVGRERRAERRQLTILFCDLVGSTSLSTSMDPEDLLELMVEFQHYCVERIEAAGGYVARFAGDGVLAYFGYPVAQEDAPQRALQAALALREAREHVSGPDGGALAVRIGVATGLVAVGDLVSAGAHERAVAGETPNMAARLQALAEPDMVLVSDATKQLTDGLFAFRSLGPQRHKGFPSATVAWEVVGARATVARYDGRRAIGLSRLVGRGSELSAILDAWSECRDGRRGVVSIVGEPGIGKSRLLEEVRGRIDQEGGVLWLEGGGASIYDNTPFHVAAQIARRLIDPGSGGDSPDDPLLTFLARGGAGDNERRDDLMAEMARRVCAAAERQPTVLVVEDLHWADPSSLELLDLILAAGGAGRFLVIYTSRPGLSHRWPRDVPRCKVELSKLDEAGSAALARAAGGDKLSLAHISAIVARADGIPLYVEELARLVAGQPGLALDDALPRTLSDLLAAKLECAGQTKRHAQVAAVLGQAFSATLLAAMTGMQAGEGEALLRDLEARGVIVQEGDACAFRHALLAAAAYDTLPKRERRELHERAAGLLLGQDPAVETARPEVVARHWTQAGRYREALEAWREAGASANQRRAFREAEHAYRQALAVLSEADVPDRDRLELTIRAAFNRVVQITQGYSASEAGASTLRAAALAERIGDPGARAREEQVKWRSVFTAGDYAEAEATVERFMALTHDHGDAAWRRRFILRAGLQQGFYTGDLARAERDFVAWESLRDDSHRAPGDDVLSMGIGGLTAQMAGRHASGRDRIHRAFEIADGYGTPYDLAMATHTEACFHHFAEDAAQLANAAARLAKVAADSGFEYASHLAMGWLAIADLDAGRIPEGTERAAAALKGIDRLGAGVSKVFWLGVLARAQWLAGEVADAEQSFRQAYACNRQELAFVPVTRMAHARLLAASGREPEAARELSRAVRLSASMGAGQFQFRALVALAGLSQEDAALGGRALRAARALAHLDHGPADRIRFDALAHPAGAGVRSTV